VLDWRYGCTGLRIRPPVPAVTHPKKKNKEKEIKKKTKKKKKKKKTKKKKKKKRKKQKTPGGTVLPKRNMTSN